MQLIIGIILAVTGIVCSFLLPASVLWLYIPLAMLSGVGGWFIGSWLGSR